ncbi:MAG: hypothetical protein AAF939_20490 [Planctomycetota bacterium]
MTTWPSLIYPFVLFSVALFLSEFVDAILAENEDPFRRGFEHQRPEVVQAPPDNLSASEITSFSVLGWCLSSYKQAWRCKIWTTYPKAS